MRAAVEAAQRARRTTWASTPPHVFAVTMLTSIAPEDLNELGLQGGPGENAIRLAALARDAGCSGVVCSAHEVADLKRFFGDDFLTLTPGIRPAGSRARRSEARHDAGAQAVAAGADYIVVGRPIVEAARSARGGQSDSRRDGASARERRRRSIFARRLARARRAARRALPLELGTAQRSLRPEVPAARRSRRCSNRWHAKSPSAFATRQPTVVVSAAVGGILLGVRSRARSSARRRSSSRRSTAARAAPRLYALTPAIARSSSKTS